MDLGLELNLRGRATKALSAEITRELSQSDIALLATERGIQPSALKRISDRHHSLARCLASGMSEAQACVVTGYTAGRISILKGDPAFEELISFYRDDKAGAVLDLQDRMTSLALDATAEIQDRLELNPDSFEIDSLTDIVKLTADRTGNGPKSTQVNVNVNLGDRMKAARQRVVPGSPTGLANPQPERLGHGDAPAGQGPILELEANK